MYKNKRQRIGLRSDSQKKRQSFDDRVWDDLSEELLQYLTIEDKLRLECVSKQFQRTVFKRQHNIVIGQSFLGQYKNVINFKTCQQLALVLKKAPNINQINFGFTVLLNWNQMLESIINYCHH